MPSGPTATATVKFTVPLTAPCTSLVSPGSASVVAPCSAMGSTPQGVYIKDVGGLELDNTDAKAPKEDSLTIGAVVTWSKVSALFPPGFT